jgi:hypothetical protein
MNSKIVCGLFAFRSLFKVAIVTLQVMAVFLAALSDSESDFVSYSTCHLFPSCMSLSIVFHTTTLSFFSVEGHLYYVSSYTAISMCEVRFDSPKTAATVNISTLMLMALSWRTLIY